MFNQIAVIVFVVAVVSAAPTQRTDVNAALRQKIEEWRLEMSNGEDSLAPLVIKEPQNVHNTTMTDIIVTGLDGFVVDILDFNLSRMHLDYSFKFPYLNIRGNYSLNATDEEEQIVIFGPFSVNGSDLNVRGFVNFTIEKGFLKIDDCETILSVDRIEVNTEGFIEDEETSALYNTVLAEAISTVMVERKQEISADFKEQVMSLFNNETEDKLTLADLIGSDASLDE